MGMEEKGNPEEASKRFLQAWNEATYDFEKFISAHYVARHQKDVSDKLKWLETALQFALKRNDDSVKSALPALYSNIAKCYEDLSDPDQAKKNYELATSFKVKPSDKGPFYHGTKADLSVGDLLTAGGSSNYKCTGLQMHNERVLLKHIQSISGHKSLSALQRYIDVMENDKEMARCFVDIARVATLSFCS
jgi:tetratricopeptide (TPR) repeat protein